LTVTVAAGKEKAILLKAFFRELPRVRAEIELEKTHVVSRDCELHLNL